MKRPKIIVTLDHMYEPTERLIINIAYLRALEDAGAEPILIGRSSKEELIRTIEHADGLLLSGGDDIDPECYNRTKKSHCRKIDPTGRDHVEMTLLEHAVQKKIPVLGICRGLQVINVFFGGTLHQDIKEEAKSFQKHDHDKHSDGTRKPRDHRAHDVYIEKNSLLHRIVNTTTLSVNSLHHQGIEMIGRNLHSIALAEDGLIEAIEGTNNTFLLGVQWHPEELNDKPSRAIFDAFIKEASIK